MKKGLLTFGIIFLFLFSAFAPMSFGTDIDSKEQSTTDNFDRYMYPEFYDCYNVNEIPSSVNIPYREFSANDNIMSEIVTNSDSSPLPLDGPMDSPWPMYCHDVRHTGRSPYSTINTWDEIWRFNTVDWAQGDIIIDEDGTIYMGSTALYAVYPDGTLKWKYVTYFHIEGAPAIDENGIIYFGTIYGSPDYLYALYPNGTLNWKYNPSGYVFSSPVIGDDGTIYFGSGGGYPPTGRINALYPNGNLKWKFDTNHVVYSSPAIGDDGTIYCGSHDTYLYALYPNNGTLKWKYKTGDWIRTSPCIGDDGTIYVVSLDSYLHAVNPDGSFKWKVDVGAGTTPTIGQDGTIYAGYKTLYAINPDNGSIKWQFDVDGTIRGGTPCNSIDGTIYIGTSEGGELIAIDSDGTEKWRRSIGECESAPAIGSDGTVYIGSNAGHLYAFGVGELEADANGPYYGLINEPLQFEGSAKGGHFPHSYHWNFGDTHTSEGQNPAHTYINPEEYDVILTVTDDEGDIATDTTFAWIQETNTPPNKPAINGQTNGNAGTSYDYTFTAEDTDESIIWYYIEWGDETNTGWLGPYNSGETITESHSWSSQGTYTIRAKAKDPYDEEGTWGTLTVTMPRSRNVISSLFLRFLENFPITEKLLKLLMF